MDQFNSSIHSHEEVSAIDKFSYLRSLLEGSAKECIEGLSVTVANCNEAIKIFQERFANPHVIITADLECLVELPTIRNVEDVIGVEKNLRSSRIMC